jgi:hypothetical protein
MQGGPTLMEPTREEMILMVIEAYELTGGIPPDDLKIMLDEARRLDAIEARMEHEFVPLEEIQAWTQPEWTKRFGKLGPG